MHNNTVSHTWDVEFIYRMTHALEDVRHFEDALSKCLQTLMEGVQAESGTVWLLSEDKTYLYPYIIQGSRANMLKELHLPYGEGIAGWVVRENQSLLIEDCRSDIRFNRNVDKMSGYVTKTLLCVPLATKEHMLGCVQLLNKVDDEAFGMHDEYLAETFATVSASYIVLNRLTLATAERQELIRIQDVTKTFPQSKRETQLLYPTSLTVYRHELLLIFGASGAGKSTLLKLMGGVDRPTSGSIQIEGVDYAKASDRTLAHLRRDKIGFIYQSHNLISNLTAYENVRLALEMAKRPSDAIDEVFSWVGLSAKKDSFPSQLSDGEQQRVAIARALAKKPDIILADEPTGALDEQTGKGILLLLERIVRERLATVVMITHNADFTPIANRIVRMSSGSINEIIENPYPTSAASLRGMKP